MQINRKKDLRRRPRRDRSRVFSSKLSFARVLLVDLTRRLPRFSLDPALTSVASRHSVFVPRVVGSGAGEMLQYPNSTYSYVSSPEEEKDGESCLENERRCESEHLE